MPHGDETIRGLIEALPRLKRLAGHTVVIKYGGSTMGADADTLWQDVLLLQQVQARVVIVHGGGPEISAMLTRLAVPAEFVSGLRKTDAAVLEVAEMVLLGKVNPRLVSQVNALGGRAIGLSGLDAHLLTVRKHDEAGDLGFVGEVVAVNVPFLTSLLDAGLVPIIAPIGGDAAGQHYNVNADSAAAAVAGALQAELFALLTDVPGLYRVDAGEKTVLPVVTAAEITAMIADGQISGGMVPKVKACLAALAQGAKQAHILDGRRDHVLLRQLLTEGGVGTMAVAARS